MFRASGPESNRAYSSERPTAQEHVPGILVDLFACSWAPTRVSTTLSARAKPLISHADFRPNASRRQVADTSVAQGFRPR